MKTFAQILLVIFFVIAFMVGLLAATFKFQILDYNFWQTTFQKNNVYENLASNSKNSFESQIDKQGGNKNDVKILTDLITTENTTDVVNKNLQNFLSFANGVSPKINVYLPIDKIPKNLLPQNYKDIKSDMPLSDLLTKFNFTDYQNLPLQNIAQMGSYSTYIIFASAMIVFIIMILLFILTENGMRLIAIGFAFILSGGLTVFLVQIISGFGVAFSNNFSNKGSVSSLIAGTLIPPVLIEISNTWQLLGIAFILFGIILFFIKKPEESLAKRRKHIPLQGV